MDPVVIKSNSVARRKLSIRKRIFGTAERPRLSVYRSEKHIYGQVIDDETGKTLVAASTVSKDIAAAVKDLSPMDAAKAIGEALAARAAKAGVSKVVFDRNGRTYAGRLKALADAARAKGLQF